MSGPTYDPYQPFLTQISISKVASPLGLVTGHQRCGRVVGAIDLVTGRGSDRVILIGLRARWGYGPTDWHP